MYEKQKNSLVIILLTSVSVAPPPPHPPKNKTLRERQGGDFWEEGIHARRVCSAPVHPVLTPAALFPGSEYNEGKLIYIFILHGCGGLVLP